VSNRGSAPVPLFDSTGGLSLRVLSEKEGSVTPFCPRGAARQRVQSAGRRAAHPRFVSSQISSRTFLTWKDAAEEPKEHGKKEPQSPRRPTQTLQHVCYVSA